MVDVIVCDVCGSRAEGVVVRKRVLGIFPVRFKLCQYCISRALRGLRKSR